MQPRNRGGATRLHRVAFGLVLGLVAHDQRRLRKAVEDGQRQYAERLEIDPEIGALSAPDDFVEDRQSEKEKRPAVGQLAPTLRRDLEGGVEQDRQERLVQGQAAEQGEREQQIERGRLDLDQRLV